MAIEELRVIIREDYGKELTDQEARDVAHTLVGFFDLLAKYDREDKQKEKAERSYAMTGQDKIDILYLWI